MWLLLRPCCDSLAALLQVVSVHCPEHTANINVLLACMPYGITQRLYNLLEILLHV